jgi:D-3-phosphoglycerate dehydrogenase
VNLDSVPPEDALDEVRRHPDILSTSLIKLPAPGATPPWLAL